MKILEARVDWHEGWANMPSIVLTVDRMPEMVELRYREKDGIYYAEKYGYVNFFYYVAPGEGYGGRTFALKMDDGNERSLKGPWSSNSSHVNAAGLGPCLEATIIEGTYRYAGHCTLSLVRDALPSVYIGPGFGLGSGRENERAFPPGSRCVLAKIDFFGNPLYTPAVRMPDGYLWRKNCGYRLLEVVE